MMHRFLFVAGKEWDNLNGTNVAKGKPPAFRLLVAHELETEIDCATRVLRLLTDSTAWGCMRPEDCSQSNSALAFRLGARAVSMVFALLVKPRTLPPYPMFRLLSPTRYPSAKEDLHRIRPCFFDDFSADHMQEYGPELDGADSVAVLACTAIDARDDNVVSELAHAYWQGEADIKSGGTIVDTVENVSAALLMKEQAVREEVLRSSKECPQPPRKKGRPQKPKIPKRVAKPNPRGGIARALDKPIRRNTGGGGAWRVFQHVRKLQKIKPRRARIGEAKRCQKEFAREASAAYQASRETPDWNILKAAGVAATVQHSITASGNAMHGLAGLAGLVLDSAGRGEPLASGALPAPGLCITTISRIPAEVSLVHDALAIASAQPLPTALSTIRRSCLAAYARGSEAKRQHSEARRRWAEQRLAEERPMDMLHLPANELQPLPAHPNLSVYEVCPSLLSIAKDVASKLHASVDDTLTSSERRASIELRKQITETWDNLHRMVTHDDSPQNLNTQPSARTSSLCRLTATCLCSNLPLRLFRLYFIEILKRVYKKSDANPFKAMFEGGFGFLHLRWSPREDEPPSDMWFYVPYANQNSWATVLMFMPYSKDAARQRIAANHNAVALRVAPEEVHGIKDPFRKFGIKLLPGHFERMDLSFSASYTIGRLCDRTHRVPDFLPAEVQVERSSSPNEFWPGSEQAIKALKAMESKGRRRSSREGGRTPAVDRESHCPLPVVDVEYEPFGDIDAEEPQPPWEAEVEADCLVAWDANIDSQVDPDDTPPQQECSGSGAASSSSGLPPAPHPPAVRDDAPAPSTDCAATPARLLGGHPHFKVPHGHIVFEAGRNFLRLGAHCTCDDHKHPTNPCRLNRSCEKDQRDPKHPRGRPLGFLLAWLEAAHSKLDRDAHFRMSVKKHMTPEDKEALSYERRLRARLKAMEDPNLSVLFGLERAQRTGEGLEPKEIV